MKEDKITHTTKPVIRELEFDVHLSTFLAANANLETRIRNFGHRGFETIKFVFHALFHATTKDFKIRISFFHALDMNSQFSFADFSEFHANRFTAKFVKAAFAIN